MSDRYFREKIELSTQRELEDIQAKKLQDTLRYSYENSLFYRKKFDLLGLKPGDIQSIADLQKLRFFTTKDDLRLSYPFGMLAVPREKIVEMHATSGTTGTPTLGFHTAKDLRDWGQN